MKYKIEVDLNTCVATGACYAADRLHYVQDKQQKANVKGGQTDESKSTGTFDDDQIGDAKAAAGACPVNAIKITQL